MALIKKLIRQISKILCEKRLIIPINSQLREPITPIYDGPQSSPLFLILYTLYLSDIPRPIDAHVNFSQFADDIAIWAYVPGISSSNIRLQKYLNKILTCCDRWRIKINPGKTHLISYSQRKLLSDTSIIKHE